jgi:multidrug efflux system outer membrane protein
MENVLSSYSNELNRNASLADNVKQNSTAAELVKHKYSSGYASLLDVLVAEMNQLVSQSSHTASDFNLRNDLVSIYSAAGGGWKGMDSKDEPRQLSEAK